MEIRKATINHLEQLSQLFNGYRMFYGKENDLSSAQEFLRDRFENNDSEIFVCENDDKVSTGFVQLYPLFSSVRMKKLWLLNDLYVAPKFRGNGISLQLIERAKKLVNQTNAWGMFLETEKSNSIGNKLYPKAGFQLNNGSNFYEWNIQ